MASSPKLRTFTSTTSVSGSGVGAVAAAASSKPVRVGVAVLTFAGFAYMLFRRRHPNLPDRPKGPDNDTGPTFQVGASEAGIVRLTQKWQGYMRVGLLHRLRGASVSPAVVSKALQRLQARHPALRSRVVLDDSQPNGMVLQEDAALRIPVRTVAVKHFGSQPDEEQLDEEWRRQWQTLEREDKVVGQPLASVLLIQHDVVPNAGAGSGTSGATAAAASGADDGAATGCITDVMFIMEHSFCDGVSLSEVCHQLLGHITDVQQGAPAAPDAVSLPWGPTVEAAGRHHPSMWAMLSAKLGLFSLIALMKNRDADVVHVPANPTVPDDNRVDASYTGHVYGKLSKRCRARGVTVTAVFGAAQAMAVEQVAPTPTTATDHVTVSLACAADTRRLSDPKLPRDSLGYHVSGVPGTALTVPVGAASRDDATAVAWELAASCRSKLVKGVKAGHPRIIAAFLGRMYQGQEKQLTPVEANPSTSVSSWGVLPYAESYGPWTVDSVRPFVNLLAVPFPGSLVSTTNGQLSALFAAPVPFLDEAALLQVSTTTFDILQAMAKSA